MKQLLIQIDGDRCQAILSGGSRTPLASQKFPLQHGIHSWSRLLSEVHDHLKLDSFAPPGMPTESGVSCRDPFRVWQVVRCGAPKARGWGWGFMLPFDATQQQVPTDTCCGFPDEDSAARAAHLLQLHRSRISGDFPGGVFEIFMLDGLHAFLDRCGEIHSTFPTLAEARGCAAKMEARQSQAETATASPP